MGGLRHDISLDGSGVANGKVAEVLSHFRTAALTCNISLCTRTELLVAILASDGWWSYAGLVMHLISISTHWPVGPPHF